MRTLALALVLAATPAFAQSAPVTSESLARRHAPLFRFNAWIPGDASPMNKSEDYFPQSVARYFDELASGRARVVVREARGDRPGVSEERRIVLDVSVEKDRIRGAPRNMAGDAPGAAPLYYHLYAKGELTYVEYWVFYPMDRARVKLMGVTVPIGGHRGDWEGITVALDAKGEIVRAFYDRHGEKDLVAKEDLRLEGEHPVVFVSQGKHASYPEPGRWHDQHHEAPLEEFDEFFLGNGCAWRSWESPLIDLEGSDASELAPPSWKKLLHVDLARWVDFAGGWGPDRPLAGLGGSPVGPKQHSDWGTAGARAKKWRDVKTARGVELMEVAPLSPVPTPVRR